MSDDNWLCKIWGRPWTCTVIRVCIVLHPVRWKATWDDRSCTGRCAATCKCYTVVHQGFEKCQVLGRVLESISRGLHRVTVQQNDRSVHSRTHRRDRGSFQESPEQASLTALRGDSRVSCLTVTALIMVSLALGTRPLWQSFQVEELGQSGLVGIPRGKKKYSVSFHSAHQGLCDNVVSNPLPGGLHQINRAAKFMAKECGLERHSQASCYLHSQALGLARNQGDMLKPGAPATNHKPAGLKPEMKSNCFWLKE